MATVPTPIGDIGAYRPHTIKQGSTFGPMTLTVYDPAIAPATVPTIVSNLTGKTFLAQIRRKGLDAAVVATMDVVVALPLTGQVEYSMTATATAALVCGERITDSTSLYTWDLDMIDAVTGRVDTLLHGPIQVYRDAAHL